MTTVSIFRCVVISLINPPHCKCFTSNILQTMSLSSHSFSERLFIGGLIMNSLSLSLLSQMFILLCWVSFLYVSCYLRRSLLRSDCGPYWHLLGRLLKVEKCSTKWALNSLGIYFRACFPSHLLHIPSVQPKTDRYERVGVEAFQDRISKTTSAFSSIA